MPNSSSKQSSQSFDTNTIQSTQTPASAPFTPFSCAHDDTDQSRAITGIYPKEQAQSPCLDDMPKADVKANAEQSIFMQSHSCDTGIAALSFSDVQCDGDYLTDKKQAIIDKLLEAASGARGLLHHEEYKPLPKPIMWALSTMDFGLMVDAVALSDTDLLAQADEIINRLSFECDLFVTRNGIDLIPALKPTTPITREKYAAFVFITETLEYSIKTFIGHAATVAEAEQLACVAMDNNPLAEGFMVERVEVDHE